MTNDYLNNIFIQVHIPRTGGTAFQNHIGDAYTKENGNCWRHYNWNEGSSRHKYSDREIPILRFRNKEQQKLLRVISGHSVFVNSHHWLRVSRVPLYITFVRDPIKRILSSFHHRHRKSTIMQEPGLFSASPLMNTNAVANAATARDYDTLWDYYKDAAIEHNLQSQWIIKTFYRYDYHSNGWQPHPTYDGNFQAMQTLPMDQVPITLPEWMWYREDFSRNWETMEHAVSKFWWITADENLTQGMKDFCNAANIPYVNDVDENRTGDVVPAYWTYEEVMKQPNIDKLIQAEEHDFKLYNYVKQHAKRPF